MKNLPHRVTHATGSFRFRVRPSHARRKRKAGLSACVDLPFRCASDLENAMKNRRHSIVFCLAMIVFSIAGTASGGQVAISDDSLEGMSIEEIRTYQSYFYANGGRDPMVMRFPTTEELGLKEDAKKKVPTVEEQRMILENAINTVTELIRLQKYDDAISFSGDTINLIDSEWPQIKPEHTDLLRMADEIRSYNRMAITLKRNQDIKNEFLSLRLKIDGVAWSPFDAMAVINGKGYSAGEVMYSERNQGDLRIEMIEEHGVVFQFKGIRFRLPVELHAPVQPTGGL